MGVALVLFIVGVPFIASAQSEDKDAQYYLGWTYATGKGVPQDDAEAIKWFRKAADQGLANAQAALGIMYATGRGVPQDNAEAVKWYRKAVDQGNVEAKALLEGMDKVRADAPDRTASRDEPAIGTLPWHQERWSRYSIEAAAAQKVREELGNRNTRYVQISTELSNRLAEVEAELKSKGEEIQAEVSISKDEFETTADFNRRRQSLQWSHRQDIQKQIEALDKKRLDMVAQLKHLGPAPIFGENSEIETVTVNPNSDVFLVPVRMGQYDADNQAVNEFTVSPFTVSKPVIGPPRVLIIRGTLRGVSLLPRVARQARESSESGQLYAVFHAQPMPLIFSRQYSIPRAPDRFKHDEERSDDLRSFGNDLIALGTGLLYHALGYDDPGGVVGMMIESKPIQRGISVKTEDTFDALVIETGWSNTCSPEQLIFWNAQSKQWERLWEAR